jgi:peptide/nickel transport system substrate-binding protein
MTSRTARLSTLIVAAALAAGCAGRDTTSSTTTVAPSTTASQAAASTSAASATPTTVATTSSPESTTPPATSDVDHVTWATYREANTLDPIYAFDYPENTVINSMCESLLLQQPDGKIAPGLATLSRPDETTMVLTLRDGVKFWDESPMTADDVVFSLQRESDPTLGGFYGAAFSRVASITATGPNVVTIKLNQPDYWLDGELSSMGGIVLSKAFVTAKGAGYGTPDGGVMCTGAYKFESWKPGDRITVTRNDSYWNGSPKVGRIDFVGVPDEAALTSGLLSGDISGSYIGAISAFDRLKADPALTVSSGLSYASGAFVVSSLSGVLGDVHVRNALSMAIDRDGLVSTLFHGQAQPSRTIANEGTWGYAHDVFAKAADALPAPTQDVAQATSMVQSAGATGKTLVLATTNEIASVATMTNAVAAAAQDIGLKVDLRAVSAANYINLFIDPNARAGIDGFVTVNYPDFADPAALYATFTLANGTQNFSGYSNAQVTAALDQARTTADPAARATLVTQAQAIIEQEKPWIGLVNPATVLVTSSKLTGAAASFVYMDSPWATPLGGVSSGG